MFSNKVGFRLASLIDSSRGSQEPCMNDISAANHEYDDRVMGSDKRESCQMNRELTPEQFDKMIHEMMSWAAPRKANSKTATGKANATLIEKIARDGRVTKQDEQSILSCLDYQRSWWQALMVMCTLNMAIIVPLLVYEEIPDNGHFSESTRNILSLVYFTGFGIAFYVSMLQLLVTLLVYALSCYVIEMKSTLYLFMQCHDLFVWINTAGMFPVLTFITSTIIGHILMVGPTQSIPCTIMGILTMILSIHIYLKVVKPIFFGIFDSEFGTWENKRHKRRDTKNFQRQQTSQSFSHLLGSVRAPFKNETVRKAPDAIPEDEEEIDLSSWKEDGPVTRAAHAIAEEEEEIDLSSWNEAANSKMEEEDEIDLSSSKEGGPRSWPLPPDVSRDGTMKQGSSQTSANAIEEEDDQEVEIDLSCGEEDGQGSSLVPTKTSWKAVTQSVPLQQQQTGMQQGGVASTRVIQGIATRGSLRGKNTNLRKQQQILNAACHGGLNDTHQSGGDVQGCFGPSLVPEKTKKAPPIKNHQLDYDEFLDNSNQHSSSPRHYKSYSNNDQSEVNVSKVYENVIYKGEPGSLTLTNKFFHYEANIVNAAVKCSWSKVVKRQLSPPGTEPPMLKLLLLSGRTAVFEVENTSTLLAMVRDVKVRMEKTENPPQKSKQQQQTGAIVTPEQAPRGQQPSAEEEGSNNKNKANSNNNNKIKRSSAKPGGGGGGGAAAANKSKKKNNNNDDEGYNKDNDAIDIEQGGVIDDLRRCFIAPASG